MKWLIKLWRKFFPKKNGPEDPRFSDQKGDATNWKKMRRVYCPRCGSPTKILGLGKIDDKVKCAKECGMRGYFDGVYVTWNQKIRNMRL